MNNLLRSPKGKRHAGPIAMPVTHCTLHDLRNPTRARWEPRTTVLPCKLHGPRSVSHDGADLDAKVAGSRVSFFRGTI
jgi:hypothetical protein